MHTSSGACASASLKNAVISFSLRASSERATMRPPRASTSLTSGASLSALRRPAYTTNPSAANLLASALPIKSPAPITAAVAFLICKGAPPLDSNDYERHEYQNCTNPGNRSESTWEYKLMSNLAVPVPDKAAYAAAAEIPARRERRGFPQAGGDCGCDLVCCASG